MMETAFEYGQIIIADLILSGDNALIIGMAAAGLAPEARKKAIFYGMVIAALLRVIFAIIATTLLDIPGILFLGALLLFWVCWRLFKDITNIDKAHEMAFSGDISDGGGHETEEFSAPKRTLGAALVSITIADVSMSLDNVLAVAAIADGDVQLLVFGLGLAIVLMACAATLIMKILTRYPWISWLGLIVLAYVAVEMFMRGVFDTHHGIGPMLGIIEGWDIGHKGGH